MRVSRNRPRIYHEGHEQEEAAVSRPATATAGPGILARMRVDAGRAGLWVAQTCCFLLVLTLVWAPHWPLYRFGLAPLPYGILDTVFAPADLLSLGIVAGWSLALISSQDRLGLSPRWISVPLLLFALAGGLATVGALDQGAALRFAIRSAGLAALYLYLHRSIAARRLAPSTLALWLVPSLAFNGLLAVAQFVHQSSLGLAWLGEPSGAAATPPTPVILVRGTRLMRAFGVLPHANDLGGLLAAGLPFVVGLLLRQDATDSAAPARRIGRGRAMPDVLLLLSVVLIVAGMMLSFSRSAWLGLLCGGLYLITRRLIGNRQAIVGPGSRRAALVAASIGLVVVGLLVVEWDAVSVRMQPTSNRLELASVRQRLTLMELSFKVIAWRPLTGVGGNDFARAADRFLPPSLRGQAAFNRVNNTYLMAQAELGPLGAVTWLALMLVPVLGLAFLIRRRRLAQTARATSAARAAPLDVSAWMQWQGLAGCSLMVVAVVGIFDWYIWVNEPVAVLWVVALAVFAAPTSSCNPWP